MASRFPRLAHRALLACAVFALSAPAAAGAAEDVSAEWLPTREGASWTYDWSNSQYAPRGATETYGIASRSGNQFRLGWTSQSAAGEAGQGFMDFRREDAGLVNVSWSSTAPPQAFPTLCASPAGCGNSLAGTQFLTVWGTRSPVLAAPLLRGATWESTGGANGEVSSANRYVGRERIVVPAFPDGVEAAKVESEVTQAGGLADAFGSGSRTVYWVYGVGPVRVVFRHAAGQVTESRLRSTTLVPRRAPSDANYFPLERGKTMTFRWSNDRHMRRASVQKLTVAAVRNQTARVDVEHVSGPIKVAGSYVLATSPDGVRTLTATTRSASRARFPTLGPRNVPVADRRRLITPLDFMAFGMNPAAPVNPVKGQTWKARKGTRDHGVFGVTGTAKVLGAADVRTPAGRFRAVAIRSQLAQSGSAYGSGTRTAYFAPGTGLVKVVFRHRDGSTSTVERTR